MILKGKMIPDKTCGLYSVGIPSIGVWSQGKDNKEALEMIEDALKMLYPDMEFSIKPDTAGKSFFFESDDPLISALLIREARSISGMSLSEMAEKMGYANHNSVYAYETGKREPTLSQLNKFLSVCGISIQLSM